TPGIAAKRVLPLDRATLSSAVQDCRSHYGVRAGGRVRSNGIHDRCVRFRQPALTGQADGDVLSFLSRVYLYRARASRANARIQHLPLSPLYSRGTVDRARDFLIGGRAAAHDRETGEPRRGGIDRRISGPYRLLVQPGWIVALHDDGRYFYRSGDE